MGVIHRVKGIRPSVGKVSLERFPFIIGPVYKTADSVYTSY